VHVAGKLVATAMNKLVQEFPCHITDMKCLQAVVKCVERAHVCPGNPQPELVDVVDKRGGLSTSDKLAFVDSAGEVVDIDGRLYGRTV